MAQWTPDNLTVKGALTAFHQALESQDTVWDKHSMIVQSTTSSENHNFPGFLPQPREFLNMRQFQNMRDFTYNVANNEYELSMIVNRKHWEDDQTGLINSRFAEMGEAFSQFKDSLFATLLAAGNVSGSNGFDGVTFHQDSRTIGSSGTIDNNIASTVTSTTAMTAANALLVIQEGKTQMLGFNDDQGRPFNKSAVKELRIITASIHEKAFLEGVSSTLIGGGNSNPWGMNVAEIDVMPELDGAATEIYLSAVGSVRKPFIMQVRLPLEIIVKAGADDVAENNGVMVLCRERFALTYGEPRRSVLNTITT